jgi:hypothetical protein
MYKYIRLLGLLCLITVALVPAHASESCRVIHGRAHLYSDDGQLRIRHIGTHHEYAPDESSWTRVASWLEDGVKDSNKSQYASPASTVCLFADFVICPTEPFKKGAVQQARVKSALHRHYVKTGAAKCFAGGRNDRALPGIADPLGVGAKSR